MQKALSEVESAVSGVTTLPEDSETPVINRSIWYEGVANISLSGPFSEAISRRSDARRSPVGIAAAWRTTTSCRHS